MNTTATYCLAAGIAVGLLLSPLAGLLFGVAAALAWGADSGTEEEDEQCPC